MDGVNNLHFQRYVIQGKIKPNEWGTHGLMGYLYTIVRVCQSQVNKTWLFEQVISILDW